jgi:signal transduction histidine kinase
MSPSRVPIRLRLTLAFALAMAVVLTATGALLYVRLASSLDETIDEDLQRRAAEVAALVERGDPILPGGGVGPPFEQDERVVQVLDPTGRVIESTPLTAERPLLDPARRGRVTSQGAVSFERGGVPGVEGPVRLLALPVESPNGRRVLLVGASLEERDEALRELLGELLVLGPVALLLASLLGYALAGAALRPVESMRVEAAAISGAEPGRRLPLPAARDEVSRLGETLNEMLGRLERALERERSFVADASHELRTPLALLKAELELALRRARSPAELEAALRSAAAETDRLAQLAEDLLILARADRGRLPLRRATLPARDVLARVADRFRQRAETAGRRLEVDAPEGLDLVADEARVQQALGNLVENALRHGRGSIRLGARERDGLVELHVLDEGTGFRPGVLPRAFQRFSQADSARGGEGVGLGLPIAAVIAEAHGGSAHAADGAEGGADVWLALPSRPSS